MRYGLSKGNTDTESWHEAGLSQSHSRLRPLSGAKPVTLRPRFMFFSEFNDKQKKLPDMPIVV